MRTELLVVGSELVSGDKLDTNGQWLCRRLGELGLPVHFSTLLGDNRNDNLAAFAAAAERADLVVTSGGLGPTQDDLTRDVLAHVAGVELREDPPSLEAIRLLFASRNRDMPDRNHVQALLPAGAQALPNRVGTAPGIWMRAARARFACLPGVPSELHIMFDEQLAPRLRAAGLTRGVVLHRVINLFGLGESEVEARALDLTARDRVPEVGITASDATISFRIRGEGPDHEQAWNSTESTARDIRDRFGDLVVGEGGDDVVEAATHALLHHRRTIALAESCTGGLIASRLASIPGISAVFRGGLVTYSSDLKTSLLGVPSDLIESAGVVSSQVAEAMARGARERLQADIGLAVTGVAGPDGGTSDTPVGRVYLGLATSADVRSRRLDLGPEQPRNLIQSRAAKIALNWVRLALIRSDPQT